MQSELDLVGQVELRLAYADAEDKLQQLLEGLLCPLLLKIGSSHEAVRNKVMSLLSHVNKRLKACTSIQLPVRDLIHSILLPFRLPSVDTQAGVVMVKNFALVYLEMGYPRLPTLERIDLLPFLLQDIDLRIEGQQRSLMCIAFQTLIDMPSKLTDVPDLVLPFLKKEASATFVLSKFLDVILFVILKAPTIDAGSNDQQISIPPGLSGAARDFLDHGGRATWLRSQIALNAVKCGILRYILFRFPQINNETAKDHLANIIFCWTYLIFTVAIADSYHEVVELADQGSKKRGRPDLENEEFVSKIYDLYLGQNGRLQPSNTVKIRLLNLLNRSHSAATSLNFIKVSFDAVFSGGSTSKLRAAGMSFLQWSARHADAKMIVEMKLDAIIVSSLMKFLKSDEEEAQDEKRYIPSSGVRLSEKETVRGMAYVAIGLLIQRTVSYAQTDPSILEELFSAAVSESSSIKPSVVEALICMKDAFAKCKIGVRRNFIQMFLKMVLNDDHRVRYAAAIYLKFLYDGSESDAKFACVLVAADEKPEVKDVATEALKPVVSENEVTVPNFLEFKNSYNSCISQVDSVYRQSGIRRLKLVPLTAVQMTTFVRYLRYLLVWNSDAAVAKYFNTHRKKLFEDEDDDVFGDVSEAYSIRETRSFIKKFIDNNNIAPFLLSVFKSGLVDEAADMTLQSVAIKGLLNVITACSFTTVRHIHQDLFWVLGFVGHSRYDVRHCAALICGISLSVGSHERTLTLVEQLLEVIKTKERILRDCVITTERKCGSLVTLSIYIGRTRYRLGSKWKSQLIKEKLLDDVLVTVSEFLRHTESVVIQSALTALAECGRYGDLDSERIQPLIAEVFLILKDTKDTKTALLSIKTLAQISIGHSTCCEKTLGDLISFGEDKKDADILFSIGEGLCSICDGWNDLLAVYEDVEVETSQEKYSGSPKLMKSTIDLLSYDYILGRPGSSGPAKGNAAKRAAVVWLFVLVKFCNSNTTIKENLKLLHASFQRLLGDADEFIQEIASKGVAMVYNIGDTDIKADLVKSLMSSFSDGPNIKESKIKVSEDTQLFDPSTLGKTPDGDSISTYKELLSLAAELNQPDLVYRFMSLASHQHLWNSRRGAAYGVSQILENATEEVKPYLSGMLPKLYRYSFDPNPKISESMRNMWKTLVKDPKKTLDENFDAIVRELLQSIGNRQWRLREASAAALADILSGRPLEQLEPHLEQLMTMSFRALDDIKESVRVVAFKACRTLTNIIVLYSDPDYASPADAERILNIMVPYLLDKGLLSGAEDVRKFSLATVTTLCKKSGKFLKPHITKIVFTLLDGMSSLEPQLLNYLSFHADKYEISAEQLESNRIAAAKMSPVLNACEQCIDYMDEDVIDDIIPKITHLIRKGTGLPTKAGAGRYVASIAMKIPERLKAKPEWADALLKALSGAIQDRSGPLRRTFATSVGYLFKFASDNAVEKLLTHIQNLYSDSEEKDHQHGAAYCFSEIMKHASDRAKAFESMILPMSFYGKNDSDEQIKNVWKDVWENNTGSASTTVKLYLSEIISIISGHIKSASWPSRIQASLTIVDLSASVDVSSTDPIPILKLLVEALSGRTWPGKENVLEALCKTSVLFKLELVNYPSDLKSITDVMVKEAKRNNLMYKRHAIVHLGTYLEAFHESVDVYDEVQDYLISLASATELNDEQMDVDDHLGRPVLLLLRASAFESLGKSFPTKRETQAKYGNDLLQFLGQNVLSSELPWNLKVAILSSLEIVFRKLDVVEVNPSSATLKLILDGLLFCLRDLKYSSVRESSSASLKSMITRYQPSPVKQRPEWKDHQAFLVDELKLAAAKEASPNIQESIKKLLIQLNSN